MMMMLSSLIKIRDAAGFLQTYGLSQHSSLAELLGFSLLTVLDLCCSSVGWDVWVLPMDATGA